jgi:hypothetical protein
MASRIALPRTSSTTVEPAHRTSPQRRGDLRCRPQMLVEQNRHPVDVVGRQLVDDGAVLTADLRNALRPNLQGAHGDALLPGPQPVIEFGDTELPCASTIARWKARSSRATASQSCSCPVASICVASSSSAGRPVGAGGRRGAQRHQRWLVHVADGAVRAQPRRRRLQRDEPGVRPVLDDGHPRHRGDKYPSRTQTRLLRNRFRPPSRTSIAIASRDDIPYE